MEYRGGYGGFAGGGFPGAAGYGGFPGAAGYRTGYGAAGYGAGYGAAGYGAGYGAAGYGAGYGGFPGAVSYGGFRPTGYTLVHPKTLARSYRYLNDNITKQWLPEYPDVTASTFVSLRYLEKLKLIPGLTVAEYYSEEVFGAEHHLPLGEEINLHSAMLLIEEPVPRIKISSNIQIHPPVPASRLGRFASYAVRASVEVIRLSLGTEVVGVSRGSKRYYEKLTDTVCYLPPVSGVELHSVGMRLAMSYYKSQIFLLAIELEGSFTPLMEFSAETTRSDPLLEYMRVINVIISILKRIYFVEKL